MYLFSLCTRTNCYRSSSFGKELYGATTCHLKNCLCFELGSFKFYLTVFSYNTWTRQLPCLALSVPLAISLEAHQGIPVEGLTLIASHFTQLKTVGEVPLTSMIPVTYVYLEVSFVLLTSFHKTRDFHSQHHDKQKKRQNPRLRGIWKLYSAVLGYLHNPCQKSLADPYSPRLNQHTLLSGAHCREPWVSAGHVSMFPAPRTARGKNLAGVRAPSLCLLAALLLPFLKLIQGMPPGHPPLLRLKHRRLA